MSTDLSRPPSAARALARFRDLLTAEWIKLWSLRSTWGSLALILLAVVGFSGYAAVATRRDWSSWSPQRQALLNPLWDAFPVEAQMFVVLAASSVGAVAVGGEYASGLFRATFAAVPARPAVAAAKVVVVTGVTTVLGLLGAFTAFGVSQAILADVDAGMSVGGPGALRGILASGLLVPVCALAGMGLAALTRHTVPAIVAAATVLLLLPTAVGDDERWMALIRHSMLLPAWQRLVDTGEPPPWAAVAHPATVAGAWTTYALWAAIAAATTIVALHRRDP